jgi:hypothetical protein
MISIIEQLLDDKLNVYRWNFHSNDWEKTIIVEWRSSINIRYFRDDIIKILGPDFMYERSLNNENAEYLATKTGLTTITNLKK